MSFSAGGVAKSGGATYEPLAGPFRLGDYQVEPELNRVSGPAGETMLEPKAMAVLVYLAERPGQVVRAKHLIDEIWHGRPMGDNPVYRCISQLRRALGDDPGSPRYIATVPTKGYRLVTAVERLFPAPTTLSPRIDPSKPKTERIRMGTRWSAVALAAVLLALGSIANWLWRGADFRLQTPPPRLTLAVLPFESAPASTENEYLAHGISEAVLNRLAAHDKLQVVGRTSSFAFKHSDYVVPRIAQLLGVHYLVQGTLRREGDRLQVSAELVDHDGKKVWSGTFAQAEGTEDFTLQDRIATAIVTSLTPQWLAPPAGGTQSSFEAWQHYLIGHELLIRRPEGFALSARAQFDQAIAIDPVFAKAYAERAIAILFLPGPLSPENNQALLDEAWGDTETALALNPDTAEAYAARGLLMQFREPRDNAAAEASLRRALELDPYLVNAWNWLANVLLAQGRDDESEEAMQIAARIDPLAPVIGANLARREVQRGLFEAAEARLRRLMAVPQPGIPVTGALIELYLNLGRLPEALALARERVLRYVEQDAAANGLDDLAWIHSMLGDWERADYWRARAEQATGEESRTPYYWVNLELQFGNPGYARSIQNLEKSLSAEGADLAEVPTEYRADYGALLALAGRFEAARELLEPLPYIVKAPPYLPHPHRVNVQHALAWAWLKSGETEQASALLSDLQQIYHRAAVSGRLHGNTDIFGYARNQLLLGDTDHALDLLAQAERGGWRDYYHVAQDPRWDLLRGDARFEALMARVKADVDAQRTAIDARMPAQAFITRLDAALQ